MDIKKNGSEPEFFDDEFGVYYDGEFYEETEEVFQEEPSASANEALMGEIERLRAEIRNIGARQEAAAVSAAPSAPAPVQAPVSVPVPVPPVQSAAPVLVAVPADGYQFRQEFDALRAFIRRSDVPLPLKLKKMLEFNRTVSRIPYGQYEDVASIYGLLKSNFLKTEISGGEAEEIISFKDYGYAIVTEDDENNTRSFLLYKEFYNPDDEANCYEIAARLLDSKNKLQENKSAASNEQLYTAILNCGAELVIGGGRSRDEVKANIAGLFRELSALTIDDVVNFPEVIRPGIKPASFTPAPAPAAQPGQEAQRPQSPFARTAEGGAPKPPKPVNPPKAHYLARIIANRMILDNLLNELDEKDLTRAQRDRIIKKLVPGASRLDDQPKPLMKIADTLVADKLNAVNKQYEKMLKARDKEIRQAAKEQAAKEKAEKAAAKAASSSS